MEKVSRTEQGRAIESGGDVVLYVSVTGNPSTTGVPDAVSATKCPENKGPAIESGGDGSVVCLSVTGNPSTTGVPDAISAAMCPATATSANEYLSRDKKFSTAKNVFRVSDVFMCTWINSLHAMI